MSRSVLQDFIVVLPGFAPDFAKQIIQWTLERIQPRIVSFEDQSSQLRELLAEIYEREEEWSEAAKALSGIPFESGHRAIQPDYKLNIFVKIAQLYLEDEDHISAEAFINRASVHIHDSKDATVQLKFKVALLFFIE